MEKEIRTYGDLAEECICILNRRECFKRRKMRYHCLFEQSGTFKNVLKEYGHEAYDYDIKNDFGETDYVVDLFKEIEIEYENLISGSDCLVKTIFNDMTRGFDFIIAFFPCTHFCDANSLQYRLINAGKRLNYDEKAVERLINRNKERAKFFELYLKFTFICTKLGIPTIIENPASGGKSNYLERYSPIDVSYYEKDRSLFGDNFKKSTNFFAINFEMKEKFIMFYDKKHDIKNIYRNAHGCTARSMISPVYAKNFYKRFL